MQEVIKLHGGKSVKFTDGNHHPRHLLIMPCLRTIKWYDMEFSKKFL
jgi:hypothetical protein